MASRKLFIPALPGNSSPNFSAKIRTVDQFIEQVAPGYKQEIANAAISKAQWKNNGSRNPKLPPVKPTGPRPDGIGGTIVFKGSKRVSEGNVSYALSSAPRPKNIHLNSGIKPNTFSNDYMTPIEGACSPLHASVHSLQLPVNSSNPLNAYFLDNICFDLQSRAQENVGFQVDIATVFTTGNILTAYSAALYALQAYFHYTSILSYEIDSRNQNAGMSYARSMIDAQCLSDLAQLGRKIQDLPIPPRMVEWVRYMCGNFYSGDSQGSPIIKIFPSVDTLDSDLESPSWPATALAALNTDANNKVFTLLRRCVPAWRVGDLYSCYPTPIYDKQFLTIFANLSNFNWVSGALNRTNTVADLNTATNYNTFTNMLDGLAFSMSNVYVTSIGASVPALTQPAGTTALTLDNRFSYYSVSNVKSFYPVVSYPFLALSRSESSVTIGTTTYKPHIFGTDKCQNVTGSALLIAGQKTLDYLFDVNSIPKGLVTHFNK